MFSPTRLSRSLALFPAGSANMKFCNSPRVLENSLFTSYNPDPTAAPACNVQIGLGSSPFARHYLGNLVLISFPQGTKMFQFPWSRLRYLFIQ